MMMAPAPINVSKADINSLRDADPSLPLDVMGLFFADRDFVGDADAAGAAGLWPCAPPRAVFRQHQTRMPVADLLDILKITKQSLARALRQLVDNGYIEQKTGEIDRRQRLLYATDKGRALFETLSATQQSRIEAAIAAPPPKVSVYGAAFLRRHGGSRRPRAARPVEADGEFGGRAAATPSPRRVEPRYLSPEG